VNTEFPGHLHIPPEEARAAKQAVVLRTTSLQGNCGLADAG